MYINIEQKSIQHIAKGQSVPGWSHVLDDLAPLIDVIDALSKAMLDLQQIQFTV